MPARSGLRAPAGGIVNETACRASEPQRPSSEMAVGGRTRYPGLGGRWTQCRRIHSSRRRTLYIVDSIGEGFKATISCGYGQADERCRRPSRCVKLSPSTIWLSLECSKRALDDGCLSNGAVRKNPTRSWCVCDAVLGAIDGRWAVP